jgi:hypothetical protein
MALLWTPQGKMADGWAWHEAARRRFRAAWVWDGTQKIQFWPPDEAALVERIWADVLEAGDYVTAAGADDRLLVDLATLADAFGRTAEERALIRAWADTLAAADALAGAEDTRAQSLADAAALVDALARTTSARNVTRAWAESMGATDAISRTEMARILALGDSVTLSETYARTAVDVGIPATPTNLSAITSGLGGIDLTWTEPGGATSYQIEVQDSALVNLLTVHVNAPASAHHWLGGQEDESYRFRIRATNASGSSAYSAWTPHTFYGAEPTR